MRTVVQKFYGVEMDGNVNEYSGWATGIVAALAGVSLGFRKLYKTWAGDGRDIQRIAAETDVVDLLRTELNRVVEQNRALASEISSLQSLVLTMKEQNLKLSLSVDHLTEQLEDLKSNMSARHAAR